MQRAGTPCVKSLYVEWKNNIYNTCGKDGHGVNNVAFKKGIFPELISCSSKTK